MIRKHVLPVVLLMFSVFTDGQVIKDSDGNFYTSVEIGNQVWLGENLKTTKFNDGKPIPLLDDATKWRESRTPAFCWLNNDVINRDEYGGLYNWYAVATKKLCPSGWHVPTDAEWNMLMTFLGNEETAGTRLKEKGDKHWKNALINGTNEYDFTALPGGLRLASGDFPTFAGSYAVWWTSTGSNTYAWNRGLFFSTGKIYKGYESMRSGFSVRCVKD